MELQCKKKEGYALSYSKAKNDDFLEDYEPKEIKRVIKKRGKAGKRQGEQLNIVYFFSQYLLFPCGMANYVLAMFGKKLITCTCTCWWAEVAT